MNKSFTLVLRHVFYNLRGGFLVRPLIIALVLGASGAALSSLEVAMPGIGSWVPSAIFPSHTDPQVAQAILGDIATAVMTVVSIVFAILLMSLTLASMQFSPRIIVSFATDRATQWTLGIFLGTFSYCIAALPAAHYHPEPTEPVITVMGAMFLALACVAWLLFFIHHISEAISVNFIVDRIAGETEAIIDELMPNPYPYATRLKPGELQGDNNEVQVVSPTSGYIRFIDISHLVATAISEQATVRVLRRVGHFIPEGVPLLKVSKADGVASELVANLMSAFDIGPSRTLQQDIEFGVLQIVDIALKAISPAVNDPSTAICCVDHLSRIMIRYASRKVPDDVYFDSSGISRVRLPWISTDRMLDSAFEQIRLYAQGDLAVSLRLLRALIDINAAVPEDDLHSNLIARGKKIVEGCEQKLGHAGLEEMRSRLRVLSTQNLKEWETGGLGTSNEVERIS